MRYSRGAVIVRRKVTTSCATTRMSWPVARASAQGAERRVGGRRRETLRKPTALAPSGRADLEWSREVRRDLIIHGRATPGAIVSHELPRDDAVRGFDQFDERVDGWTRLVLHPAHRGAVRRWSDRTLRGLCPGSCARLASTRGRGAREWTRDGVW